jgi:hypothetical protein
MSVAPLHPLKLDPTGRLAELAGVAYLASVPLRAKDGRQVLYLTEAAQPEHVYKFIGPLPDGGALQHGALYVARLGEAGHGRWSGARRWAMRPVSVLPGRGPRYAATRPPCCFRRTALATIRSLSPADRPAYGSP